MDILSKAFESFQSQGIIGWSVITLIIVALIMGVKSGSKVKKTYQDLLNKFNSSEEKVDDNNQSNGERIIEDEVLSKIVSEFTRSAKNGTENINTEVILQKNIGNDVIEKERLIKLLPSVCIGLGLLGTFIGLTLAIIDTNGVLGNIGSMEEFSNKMQGPFASMSSAFWTSIFGVASSLILNWYNNTVQNDKDSFYDIIEDYLDNVIYSKYAKSFNNLFETFNTTISTTMTGLAKDMRDLFQDGVSQLVNKINKNSIDLTSSVKELTNYTKDLDRLTKSLNNSVNNFKDPVDKFKVSVYEFTSITEDLSISMKESMNKFAVKVDVLDSNLSNLYNSIDSNKREIAEIGSLLKNESERLNDSYHRVLDLINSVSNIQTDNTESLKEQIGKLNKGYENFDSGLVQFVGNLESLQTRISDGISNTLDREMTSLTNNIVDKLSISMKEVAGATEQLTKNTITIGEVVKASNDLWMASNKEVTVEER